MRCINFLSCPFSSPSMQVDPFVCHTLFLSPSLSPPLIDFFSFVVVPKTIPHFFLQKMYPPPFSNSCVPGGLPPSNQRIVSQAHILPFSSLFFPRPLDSLNPKSLTMSRNINADHFSNEPPFLLLPAKGVLGTPLCRGFEHHLLQTASLSSEKGFNPIFSPLQLAYSPPPLS